jgi:hypothetical protein
MHVRIFSLKFNAALGQFDDTALQDFIKDKEVLSIRDHFLSRCSSCAGKSRTNKDHSAGGW